MHTDSNPSPGTSHAAGRRIVAVLCALALLGLAAWFYVRVDETTSAREKLQAQLLAPVQARGMAVHADVQTVFAEPVGWQPDVRIEGTLNVHREADLGFMASGRLEAVNVESGQAVQKGQAIARLESTQAQAQRDAVAAQVKAARAQLGIAEDSVGRTKPLVESGALPSSAGVQVEGQQQLVRAQLDAVLAQQALTEINLDNHVVRAPFPGIITRAPNALGMVVGAGIPLFHIVDVRRLRLMGTVSADDAMLLAKHDPIEVSVQGRTLTGQVTAILPTVDPITRRVPVEAVVANEADLPVFAGVLVRARVQATRSVTVLKAPASVLKPGSQDEVVVVAGGMQRPRRVTFVSTNDGSLLIRSGITEKDALVLHGSGALAATEVIRPAQVTP